MAPGQWTCYSLRHVQVTDTPVLWPSLWVGIQIHPVVNSLDINSLKSPRYIPFCTLDYTCEVLKNSLNLFKLRDGVAKGAAIWMVELPDIILVGWFS